ncbi:MAG: hypothetical protein IPL52_11870 [Flavobacteriales bacterium]|nr:hypothetical protein [Flavobacteriales bacterium]
MNTNWSKILLFTLLGFALGFAICCLTCGRCSRGGGDCHGGMSMCDHGGSCCSGEGSRCDKEGCDHKMGAACCKGHQEGRMACCKGGHGMGHGDGNVKVIVADLEKAGFQGDTTIAIAGGTVHVSRMGDSTQVKVEMKEVVKEEVHEHMH